MTFRYPSIVNDRSWKSIGRLPKANIPPACNYDPAELIRDILKQEDLALPSPPPAAQATKEKEHNNKGVKRSVAAV